MNKKPTIIILDGKNPLKQTGGYQTYAYNLAKLLNELGFKTLIICFDTENRNIETETGEVHTVKSKLISLPFLKDASLSGLAILGPLLARAASAQLKPDQPYIIWGIGPWSFAGALIKFFNKKRTLVFFSYYPTTFKHEFKASLRALSDPNYPLLQKIAGFISFYTIIQVYTLFERFFLRYADRIINHYESIEKILMGQFRISDKKFVRLPYFSQPVKKTVSGKKITLPPKPRILLVCRQDARKGIVTLLEAFKILQDKKIPYHGILVGGGPLLKTHKNIAGKMALKNVMFTGYVPDATFFLKQAQIFVFPSLEEGSSAISILEAMQYGLPIVSTNVDGIPEDLTDKKNALLIDPHDPILLAHALEKLLRNPEFAHKIGRQARIRFERVYNRIKVKKSLQKFLETYLQNKNF